jgi:hypothetical protein
VIATVEELTRHEIVLREETAEGVQLVFPAAFRQDLPAAAEPHGDHVEFGFEGPIATVYATLVVRLSRSSRFHRTDLWQSAARFAADTGGRCMLHLVASDEGRGMLRLSAEPGVALSERLRFERFVSAHLDRRATPGSVRRRRRYVCPECDAPFSTAQIDAARIRRRSSLICPVDESRIDLDDDYERALAGEDDRSTQAMDAAADSARRTAAASSVLRGKEETADFDVSRPASRQVPLPERHGRPGSAQRQLSGRQMCAVIIAGIPPEKAYAAVYPQVAASGNISDLEVRSGRLAADVLCPPPA